MRQMSLAEIEKAVDALSPKDLANLAAYIARHDKLAWDEEIERDFSADGKHADSPKKIDAQIEAGNFTPFPCLRQRASVLLEVLSRAASTHSKTRSRKIHSLRRIFHPLSYN